METRRFPSAALTLIAIFVFLAPPALAAADVAEADANGSAAPYQFTRLADDTGSFTFCTTFPLAMNDGGAVAAFICNDDLSLALVRFDDLGMTTIAVQPAIPVAGVSAVDTIVGFGGGLGIDNAGTVAFDATFEDGSEGVFAGNGGSLTVLAVHTDPADPYYYLMSFNKSGWALMGRHEGCIGCVVALVAGNGGPLATVYHRNDLPEEDIASPGNFLAGDLYDSGDVAFIAGNFGQWHYVYRGSVAGGPLVRVASPDLSPPGDLPSFGNSVAVNGAGTVTFVGSGELCGPASFCQVIYAGADEGSLTTLATGDGPYTGFGFGGPRIDDSGLVAFHAYLDFDLGLSGVFTGPDPVTDGVIATGDPLDGATMDGVFEVIDVNRFDQVAFIAYLSDGRIGLYVGTPTSFIFADGFESGDTTAWSNMALETQIWTAPLCRLVDQASSAVPSSRTLAASTTSSTVKNSGPREAE